MLARLQIYASFVRFSHSVFALPFALTGALLAFRIVPIAWTRGLWIVACMVAARSAAMGFNRLVDAEFDRRNPRTAMRELPTGAISRREAIWFVVLWSIAFVVFASQLGRTCLILSPVALAIVFWYSIAKRYTTYTQLYLGLAMAVAPVGGWIAAGGPPRLEPWVLGLAIGTWVAGFDVLYACQDVEFDRRERLQSIPVRFGIERALWISRAMHVVTIAGPCGRRRACRARAHLHTGSRRWWRRCSCTSSRSSTPGTSRASSAPSTSTRGSASCTSSRPGSMSTSPDSGEHVIRRTADRRSRRRPVSRRAVRLKDRTPMTDPAATRRIAIGVTGASGSIYAVRTIAALLEIGCELEIVFSDYGRRLLVDEIGPDAKVERLQDLLVERHGEAVRRGRFVVHSNRDLGAALASGSHRCDGDGDRALLDEDAGSGRPRAVAEPH